MSESLRTVVQCDFDGTITEEDISFAILEEYADGDWRRLLREHEAGKISVGSFNRQAFAMVRADHKSLTTLARRAAKIRAGFESMVAVCRRKGFELEVVSNGLDFYIEEILCAVGFKGIPVHAAETKFHPEGLKVRYVTPDGNEVEDNFKGAYTSLYLDSGRRVIYMGNGNSDFAPARRCHHIFATGTLLTKCRGSNVNHTGFNDFHEVNAVLEQL